MTIDEKALTTVPRRDQRADELHELADDLNKAARVLRHVAPTAAPLGCDPGYLRDRVLEAAWLVRPEERS